MKFYQANQFKIKPGRKYFIFLKKKIVRVEIINHWEEYTHKINGEMYIDIGFRVKRIDNGKVLMKLRAVNELFTRNGS